LISPHRESTLTGNRCFFRLRAMRDTSRITIATPMTYGQNSCPKPLSPSNRRMLMQIPTNDTLIKIGEELSHSLAITTDEETNTNHVVLYHSKTPSYIDVVTPDKAIRAIYQTHTDSIAYKMTDCHTVLNIPLKLLIPVVES